MTARTLYALCALALAAPAVADPIRVTYLCERGVTVPVIYTNDTHAIALIEGDLRLMAIAVSASGARYREPGEGYQLWSKGGEATILYGEDTLLGDCVEQDPVQ